MQTSLFSLSRRSTLAPCAAAKTGQAAGDNPLGRAFEIYEIGTANTIRWGVFKRPVVPPPQKNGKPQTFEQYRKATEPRRQQLREEFADKLEVISYEERDRRGKAGLVIAAVTAVAAAFLVFNNASWTTRLWLYPGLAFSVAFLDSARLGLCTESMAGAWDVDDTGLEYMPTQELAWKIQEKVIKMYFADGAIALGLLALCCRL